MSQEQSDEPSCDPSPPPATPALAIAAPASAPTVDVMEPVAQAAEASAPGAEATSGRAGAARRLGRLASGALAAAVTTATRQPSGGLSTLRAFAVPLSTLIFLAILLVLFKEILLPFILALVIVYLMEPIVGRVGRTPESPTGLPRWAAVILVYLTFFGVVTTTVVLFMPRLIAELVRFTETVPQEIQTFRTQKLPSLNKEVQRLVSTFSPAVAPQGAESAAPGPEPRVDLEPIKALVHASRRQSAAWVSAQAEASRLVRLASQVEILEEWEGMTMIQRRVWRAQLPQAVARALAQRSPSPQGGQWILDRGPRGPALRVVPDRQGGLAVYLDDLDVELVQTGERAWQLKPASEQGELQTQRESSSSAKPDKGLELQQMFDLERGLDSLIEGVAKSSNAKLTSLLTLAQGVVVGIIQAFVAMILTLMVAAFISIDLHSVMGFFKAMFPKEHHVRYDELMREMDRGLSGVVRGQLMICLVNGVLTYVGLAMLGIKFSLLLALVAGCLSLIPIFGTILSTIPIVLFGLTDGLMVGLFALMWILFIHFVEANILNPKIIGSSAHIHPVIVIFALLAGESAFGLMGALLAVPTASIVLTLFKFFLLPRAQDHEAASPEAASQEAVG